MAEDVIWEAEDVRAALRTMPSFVKEKSLLFVALRSLATVTPEEAEHLNSILKANGKKHVDTLSWVTQPASLKAILASAARNLGRAVGLLAVLNPICALTAVYKDVHLMVHAGAAELAIAALREHWKDQRIVQLCCAILSNLAQHTESTTTLIDMNVHLFMAEVLRHKAYFLLIQASAITALANLANTRSPAVHRALLRADVTTLCCQLLQLPNAGSNIYQHASLCLANLATSVESHSTLAQSNSIAIMAAVTVANIDEELLAENFAAMLARIAHGNQPDRPNVLQFTREILLVLIRHAGRPRLRTFCCAVLLCIEDYFDTLSYMHHFEEHAAGLAVVLAAAVEAGEDFVVRTLVHLPAVPFETPCRFPDGRILMPAVRAAELGNVRVVHELTLASRIPVPASERARVAGEMGALPADQRTRRRICLDLLTDASLDIEQRQGSFLAFVTNFSSLEQACSHVLAKLSAGAWEHFVGLYFYVAAMIAFSAATMGFVLP
eukprot:m.63836 g.63836  ORF g.63836 m.63836 type:complete len:496 (-) comp12490_c0_seq2:83-1570(-)